MSKQNEARQMVRRIVDDDRALLAWLLDVARATPDVYLRTPPGGATLDTRLREGLGLDSIGRVCVFYGIADAIGIDEGEQVVATWATLADVAAFVRTRIGPDAP